MERIYSAAIWYKQLPTAKRLPNNILYGVVVKGHRHADIIETVYNLLGKRTVRFAEDGVGEHEQGFVTNQNRYVNRTEAMVIALKAKQVKSNLSTELFSEDLY